MKEVWHIIQKIEKMQLNLLKKSLKFIVKKSKYYKNKLENHGINVDDIKSLDDIRKLPFTYPKELKDNPYDFLTAPIENINFLACSSGTTEVQKVAFKNLSTDEFISKNYAGMLKHGKNDKAAIINLPGSPSVFGSQFTFLNEKIPPVIITIEINHLKILEILKKLKINIIKTTPPYMFYLTNTAEKANINLKKLHIKTIILSGSRLTENLRNYLKSEWGAEVFNRYSSLEFGNIANECRKHDGLHVNIDRIFVEVIDPITKEPVKEGESGTLTLTSLKKYSMSFIRYWTGDIVKFTTKKCKCGSKIPRIWVFGRQNEMIPFRKKVLDSSQIYDLLEDFKKISGYFRLLISSSGKIDILNFKIETLREENISEKLKNEIQNKLESFFKKYKTGNSLKVNVQMIPPNSFLILPDSGGAKPKDIIIDKRIKK